MTLELHSSIQSQKITPPKAPGLPIVGYIPFMGKHPHKTFTHLAKKYGDVFQLQLGSRTVIVLNGLDTLRQASLKQQEDFAGRPKFHLLNSAARNLTMGARDYDLIWKRQREIAAKATQLLLSHRKAFIEQIAIEEAAELTNIFLNYRGQPFDPRLEIGMAFANLAYGLVFGKTSGRDEQDLVFLVDHIHYFIGNGPGTLLIDFLPQQVRGLSRIFEKQKLQEVKQILGLIDKFVLRHLKEHQDSYDPENLRDVTDGLLHVLSEIDESEKQTLDLEKRLLEGTTTELMGSSMEPNLSILRWALIYMITNSEIQTKVQQELDKVVGRDRPVCLEDRKELPFTEAFIQETLRYMSPFPLALPHSTTTDTTINSYFIPKNTTVLVNLYGLTRDERYWEEPEKFNPHRFLSADGKLREDLLDKHYPFGLGKRKCFGEYLGRLQLFLILANVMHKCKFDKVPGEKLSFESSPGVTPMPKSFKVIVKPRF